MVRQWLFAVPVVGIVGLGPFPAGVFASVPAGGSLTGNQLVLESSLTGGEEAQAQQEAEAANPETIRLHTESEVAYEGLSTSQSQALADRSFAGTIDVPAGGPPALQAGETLEGFPTNNAMAVLDEGRQTVIESVQPIAVQTGPGERVPIDLSLYEVSGGFAPKTATAAGGVSLPRHLSEGAALTELGVSLTPVDEDGSSLQAGGGIDGG